MFFRRSKDALLRNIKILRAEIPPLENAIKVMDPQRRRCDEQITDLQEKLARQEKRLQEAETEFQQKYGRNLRGKSKSEGAQETMLRTQITGLELEVLSLTKELNSFTELKKTIEESSLIQQLAKKQKLLKEAEAEFKKKYEAAA